METTHADGDVVLRSWTEPEAFGGLFDRHFEDVRAYFARRVDVESASDLAAEVFRIAFERRRSFDPARSPSCRPWLYGIARNVLAKDRDRARRSAALAARIGPSLAVAGEDDIDASLAGLEAAHRWEAVAEALARMDDDSRELLLLVAWDALTYAEAAQVFDVPVGTIRSRLSRARAELNRLVGGPATDRRHICHD